MSRFASVLREFRDGNTRHASDDVSDIVLRDLDGRATVAVLRGPEFLQFFLLRLLFLLQFEREVVLLFFHGLLLFLYELFELVFGFLQFRRGLRLLQAFACRGLIEHVNSFVRKVSLAQVALAQGDGGFDGFVGDFKVVKILEALLESFEDQDGVLRQRLLDHDGLEPALESAVFLDRAVFIHRRRADDPERSAGESGFQNIRSIQGPFRGSRADDRVHLVDEEDDLVLALRCFLDNVIEALFKFAPVLGTSDERTHVEDEHADISERLRNGVHGDALCETFDDGGLSYARFADENGGCSSFCD